MSNPIIGLTGGICSGKSTAAAVIAKQGVRVIDADAISHYLTTYDPDLLTEIAAHFGESVFHVNGALNRSTVARVVFSSDTQRSALEGILHPPIDEVIRQSISWARKASKPLVVMAPLLIEAGIHVHVDVLWVVAATRENQRLRLMARMGATRDDVGKWIEAQMPLAEKKKLADTVIDNDGTIEELEEAVLREWDALCVG